MRVSQSTFGVVRGIAVKTARRAPLVEVAEAEAVEGGGITADLPVSPKRGITLLDLSAWKETCREIGEDLPWTTRRANVLVEGIDLQSLIGKTVRLGGVELAVGGETDPCSRMREFHPDLEERLKPHCRGGVYGRVVRGGVFRVGDSLEVVSDPDQ